MEIGWHCSEPGLLTAARNISTGSKFTLSEGWSMPVLVVNKHFYPSSPAHQRARKAGREGFQSAVNAHAKPASRGCQALETFNLLPEQGARLRGREGSFSAPLGEKERKVWSCPYFFLNRIPLQCLRSESNAHFLFWTETGSHVNYGAEEYLCPLKTCPLDNFHFIPVAFLEKPENLFTWRSCSPEREAEGGCEAAGYSHRQARVGAPSLNNTHSHTHTHTHS